MPAVCNDKYDYQIAAVSRSNNKTKHNTAQHNCTRKHSNENFQRSFEQNRARTNNNIISITNMVDLQDRLVALLEAEMSSDYRTVDYLSPKYQQDLRPEAEAAAAASGSSSSQDLLAVSTSTTPTTIIDTAGWESTASLSSSLSSSSSTAIMTESWREKITEWTYQVIDHFNYSREIADIVMNYLDRFLARCVPTNIAVTKKTFQLAAMTSCYLAVKLYEPKAINVETMIQLSRGFFTPGQMEAMELSILR